MRRHSFVAVAVAVVATLGSATLTICAPQPQQGDGDNFAPQILPRASPISDVSYKENEDITSNHQRPGVNDRFSSDVKRYNGEHVDGNLLMNNNRKEHLKIQKRSVIDQMNRIVPRKTMLRHHRFKYETYMYTRRVPYSRYFGQEETEVNNGNYGRYEGDYYQNDYYRRPGISRMAGEYGSRDDYGGNYGRGYQSQDNDDSTARDDYGRYYGSGYQSRVYNDLKLRDDYGRSYRTGYRPGVYEDYRNKDNSAASYRSGNRNNGNSPYYDRTNNDLEYTRDEDWTRNYNVYSKQFANAGYYDRNNFRTDKIWIGNTTLNYTGRRNTSSIHFNSTSNRFRSTNNSLYKNNEKAYKSYSYQYSRSDSQRYYDDEDRYRVQSPYAPRRRYGDGQEYAGRQYAYYDKYVSVNDGSKPTFYKEGDEIRKGNDYYNQRNDYYNRRRNAGYPYGFRYDDNYSSPRQYLKRGSGYGDRQDFLQYRGYYRFEDDDNNDKYSLPRNETYRHRYIVYRNYSRYNRFLNRSTSPMSEYKKYLKNNDTMFAQPDNYRLNLKLDLLANNKENVENFEVLLSRKPTYSHINLFSRNTSRIHTTETVLPILPTRIVKNSSGEYEVIINERNQSKFANVYPYLVSEYTKLPESHLKDTRNEDYMKLTSEYNKISNQIKIESKPYTRFIQLTSPITEKKEIMTSAKIGVNRKNNTEVEVEKTSKLRKTRKSYTRKKRTVKRKKVESKEEETKRPKRSIIIDLRTKKRNEEGNIKEDKKRPKRSIIIDLRTKKRKEEVNKKEDMKRLKRSIIIDLRTKKRKVQDNDTENKKRPKRSIKKKRSINDMGNPFLLQPSIFNIKGTEGEILSRSQKNLKDKKDTFFKLNRKKRKVDDTDESFYGSVIRASDIEFMKSSSEDTDDESTHFITEKIKITKKTKKIRTKSKLLKSTIGSKLKSGKETKGRRQKAREMYDTLGQVTKKFSKKRKSPIQSEIEKELKPKKMYKFTVKGKRKTTMKELLKKKKDKHITSDDFSPKLKKKKPYSTFHKKMFRTLSRINTTRLHRRQLHHTFSKFWYMGEEMLENNLQDLLKYDFDTIVVPTPNYKYVYHYDQQLLRFVTSKYDQNPFPKNQSMVTAKKRYVGGIFTIPYRKMRGSKEDGFSESESLDSKGNVKPTPAFEYWYTFPDKKNYYPNDLYNSSEINKSLYPKLFKLDGDNDLARCAKLTLSTLDVEQVTSNTTSNVTTEDPVRLYLRPSEEEWLDDYYIHREKISAEKKKWIQEQANKTGRYIQENSEEYWARAITYPPWVEEYLKESEKNGTTTPRMRVSPFLPID